MVPVVINKRLRRATVIAVIIKRRKIRKVSNVEKVCLAISPKTKKNQKNREREREKWKKKYGTGRKRQNHKLKCICFKLPKVMIS